MTYGSPPVRNVVTGLGFLALSQQIAPMTIIHADFPNPGLPTWVLMIQDNICGKRVILMIRNIRVSFSWVTFVSKSIWAKNWKWLAQDMFDLILLLPSLLVIEWKISTWLEPVDSCTPWVSFRGPDAALAGTQGLVLLAKLGLDCCLLPSPL